MLSIYFISGSVTTALHPYKSDAITLGTAQRAHSIPNISTITVAEAIVPISDHVRLLCVTLDNRLTFDTRISAMSKSCFFNIRALHHIRPEITTVSAKRIACSLLGCRLDYTNAALVGIWGKNIKCLLCIKNTLA